MTFENLDALATTQLRKDILKVIESGFDAIDTKKVIESAVRLDGTILHIKEREFNLKDYNSVHVIGCGKVVCEAMAALDGILGDAIDGGIAIGTHRGVCDSVRMYEGSHPMPSPENVNVSKEIVDLSERLGEKDLVIVVVSGGGSALLCWPPEEAEQGKKLYQEFLNTGGSIQELNTLRKHISLVKGGGLAKILYPANVVGLIFSDVPGNSFVDVASGLTYKDETTVADAQAIIKKYSLGEYVLNETPKEPMYFEKVINIPMVSNQYALDAMSVSAQALGYAPTIISNELYDAPEKVCDLMFAEADKVKPNGRSAILAGGEPSLHVPEKHGRGGRNQQVTLTALDRVTDRDAFVSIGSDGIDNSPAAGAVADVATKEKASKLGLSSVEYAAAFDAYSFFEKTGDLIVTGPTGANVSDLMVLLRDGSGGADAQK